MTIKFLVAIILRSSCWKNANTGTVYIVLVRTKEIFIDLLCKLNNITFLPYITNVNEKNINLFCTYSHVLAKIFFSFERKIIYVPLNKNLNLWVYAGGGVEWLLSRVIRQKLLYFRVLLLLTRILICKNTNTIMKYYTCGYSHILTVYIIYIRNCGFSHTRERGILVKINILYLDSFSTFTKKKKIKRSPIILVEIALLRDGGK